MWTAADIEIVLDNELSAGSVVTADIRTPEGSLRLITEIERYDHELVLAGLHIQGENLRPNQLGWARLRQIALAVAEIANVDTIVVKGATRTTGAVPGRLPVRSGSPARYHLSADPTFTKTVSAVIALRRRHVPIIEAKASIERLVAERDIAIDLPMLEHAAVFEAELRELGVRATREASSAAAEG